MDLFGLSQNFRIAQTQVARSHTRHGICRQQSSLPRMLQLVESSCSIHGHLPEALLNCQKCQGGLSDGRLLLLHIQTGPSSQDVGDVHIMHPSACKCRAPCPAHCVEALRCQFRFSAIGEQLHCTALHCWQLSRLGNTPAETQYIKMLTSLALCMASSACCSRMSTYFENTESPQRSANSRYGSATGLARLQACTQHSPLTTSLPDMYTFLFTCVLHGLISLLLQTLHKFFENSKLPQRSANLRYGSATGLARFQACVQ